MNNENEKDIKNIFYFKKYNTLYIDLKNIKF